MDDLVSVNRKVTLVVLQGEDAGTYSTRVVDVRADSVSVATPTRSGGSLKVEAGCPVRVRIPRGDAMYYFDGMVQSVTPGPVPLLRLARPGAVAREQKRYYVRVPASLRARWQLADDEEGERHLSAHTATTVNVSGGGVLVMTLHSDEDVNVGSAVDIEIDLPDARVSARGVVVRVDIQERQGRPSRTMALEFADIDERQRDLIMKYVFQRQLELRRKGLL